MYLLRCFWDESSGIIHKSWLDEKSTAFKWFLDHLNRNPVIQMMKAELEFIFLPAQKQNRIYCKDIDIKNKLIRLSICLSECMYIRYIN